MTGPRQPRTCSHLINDRTLTATVREAVASLELNGTFQGQFYVVCSGFCMVRLF